MFVYMIPFIGRSGDQTNFFHWITISSEVKAKLRRRRLVARGKSINTTMVLYSFVLKHGFVSPATPQGILHTSSQNAQNHSTRNARIGTQIESPLDEHGRSPPGTES